MDKNLTLQAKLLAPSRLQEVRTKYGMEAAQLYADHKRVKQHSNITHHQLENK